MLADVFDAERLQCFSSTYAESRAKFLQACQLNCCVMDWFQHPCLGPDGEAIGTDVAVLGPTLAPKQLVIISGTHGLEGYCGAAIQQAVLEQFDFSKLPGNISIAFIHGLNPYGFAWNRRVDENNVDLNRNFIDWNAPLAPNPWYGSVHDILFAAEPYADALNAFITQQGVAAMEQALTCGQHTHGDGLFYGGTGPSWSNQLVQTLSEKVFCHASELAIIDIHSGLGPYGYGQPISFDHPHSRGLRNAKKWYGPALGSPRVAATITADLKGTLYDGLHALFPDTPLTSIALEFGTYSKSEGIARLRDEALAWHDATPPSDTRATDALKDFFYVNKRDWKESVLFRGKQIVQQAIHGLTEDNSP